MAEMQFWATFPLVGILNEPEVCKYPQNSEKDHSGTELD